MDLDVEHVLLDSDGTLIDSTAAIMEAWRVWSLEFGVSSEAFSEISVFGRPVEHIVADLVAPADVSRAARRYKDLELADPRAVPLNGVRNFLQALPVSRWAVVTSACNDVAKSRLRQSGLSTPMLITADDVVQGKPHPEPFLLAAARLGADPASCVVIEDSPAGLTAGRAAGMRTIAVTTTHPREQLDADLIISDLASLRVSRSGSGIRLTVVNLTSPAAVPV